MFTKLAFIFFFNNFIIRLEAFELVHMRRQKAEEFRIAKINQQNIIKTQKSEAIKKGYKTLEYMSEIMRTTMTRATLELRSEINFLQDNISADNVINKAIDVSNNIIFPR